VSRNHTRYSSTSTSPAGSCSSRPAPTGTDRQKYRNIQRDPRVSVSILDPDDPYRYLEVRGRVVKIEPDLEKAFLNQLARKYLDLDAYPYEQRRNVERVIPRIQPDHVVT
jgi:PPOX class probable F420-dependent enzyme